MSGTFRSHAFINKTKIMKNKNTFPWVVLPAVILAVGCSKEETSSQPLDRAATEAASRQLDKLKSDTKQAERDLKDYTYAQKAEVVEHMQTRLAGLKEDLDRLSARIEKSSDTLKAQAEPKLQALRDQLAGLKRQLDELKNANESTWDSVKASFQKASDALKDGFAQVRQWVSEHVGS